MREVAFIYIHESSDSYGDYNTWSFSNMVETWTEVDDETFSQLCTYFHRTSYYTKDGKKLIMVERCDDDQDALAPKLISDVKKLAAAYALEQEVAEKKRLQKKAETLRKKMEQDEKTKRELLEQLKKELGEK